MITEFSRPVTIGGLVPALPSSVLEPLWVQVSRCCPPVPIPIRSAATGPGSRPDRVRQAHPGAGVRLRLAQDRRRQLLGHDPCRRRDEWISAGVAEQLRLAVLAAYDRLFGLELEHLAVDGCTTKAPCGARLPAPARSTGANKGGNARWPPTPAASRWPPWRPRPTSATVGSWPRPWTPSPWSGRCPSGRCCTWMPATTTSRAGRSWPNARWWARSPLGGSRHRSRRVAGG